MCGLCLAFQTRPERPPHRDHASISNRRNAHDQEDSQSASLRGQYGRSFVGHGGRAVRAGAYAAGKLAIGFWDHWVPGANKGAEAVAKAWAEKEKVDL